MRDREVIEREMYRAREDLEQSLAELKHVVREKVDVKARARVALDRAQGKAYQAYERGKESALHYAELGRDGMRNIATRGRDEAAELYAKAKERPVTTGAIIGG